MGEENIINFIFQFGFNQASYDCLRFIDMRVTSGIMGQIFLNVNVFSS